MSAQGNNGATTPPPTAATGQSLVSMSSVQGALYLLAILLPAVLSIVSSLRQDLAYAPKIAVLRHASAVVLSETYRFRAQAGGYGDRALSREGAPHPGGSGGGGGETAVHDTISARAARLTQRLVDVSARIVAFDRPDAGRQASPPRAWPETAAGWWCGAPWARRVGAVEAGLGGACSKDPREKGGGGDGGGPGTHAGRSRTDDVATLAKDLGLNGAVAELFQEILRGCQSERRFGVMSGDDYVQARLVPGKMWCEREADRIERSFIVHRLAAYLIGALGSILSLLHFEVSPPLPHPVRPRRISPAESPPELRPRFRPVFRPVFHCPPYPSRPVLPFSLLPSISLFPPPPRPYSDIHRGNRYVSRQHAKKAAADIHSDSMLRPLKSM